MGRTQRVTTCGAGEAQGKDQSLGAGTGLQSTRLVRAPIKDAQLPLTRGRLLLRPPTRSPRQLPPLFSLLSTATLCIRPQKVPTPQYCIFLVVYRRHPMRSEG